MADNVSLKGKWALVTGSTTGIGRGIAHALAKRGCSVILTGLIEEDAIPGLVSEFQSKYVGEFQFIPSDFLLVEETQTFCQQVVREYPGGVDILVNNAGLPGRSPIESLPVQVWNDTLAVNLTAPFLLTQTFLPLMKKKGWGRIINISSQMGLIGEAGKLAYCTTKAGLLGFSRVVALEGALFGVTCNAICPGFVDAPMCHSMVEKEAALKGISFEQSKLEFARERTPMARLVTVDDLAELVVFLSSDAASCISGSPIPIDSANMAR